jgi:gluconolactonase
MDGRRFSGPNDIAIAADDAVYVTDNDFGLRDGGRKPDKQLQNGGYRIKDGKTTLVLSGADLGGTPNGIALSPDGKWMYLSTANRRMRRYAVNSNGTPGAFTVFTEGVGIGDGEKTDRAGNAFSTGGAGPGIIRITSPAGKLLGTINLPTAASPRDRSVRRTSHSAVRMAGPCSWRDAIPSTST